MRLTGKREKGSMIRDRSPQCSGPEGWIKVLTGVVELTEEARGSAWQNFGVVGTSLLERQFFPAKSFPGWDPKPQPLSWIFRCQGPEGTCLSVPISMRKFGKCRKVHRKECK